MEKYTCPCCGYKTFDTEPGSYDLCPICDWEDDAIQLANLTSSGANAATLIEAQNNFEKFGASDHEQFIQPKERPSKDDVRDPKWRKVDLQKDNIKQEKENGKYYWLM